MDAIGLFTNILHEEGMSEITTSLDKRINKEVPTEFIMVLMEIILYQNIFEFHDGYYKPKKMGLLWEADQLLHIQTTLWPK